MNLSQAYLFNELGALEVTVFDGGGELHVGQHNLELQPGRYVVARLQDEADQLPPNQLYGVKRPRPAEDADA